jgi:GNAT superfamily N-acetyltransferase
MPVDVEDGLRICLATKGDSQAFIDLFNSIYLRKVDAEYFQWQFFDQTIDSSLIKAEVDGELVGTHGHHFLKAHMLDRDFPLLCGIDTMVDKEYRGRGIYRTMLEYFLRFAAEKRTPIIYAMANRNTFLVLTERMGWKLITEIENMACGTNIKPYSLKKIQIEKVSSFDDRVVNIINRFLKSHSALFIIGRDTAYLNWRFVHHPIYQYEIFQINSNSQIYGYLVLKVYIDSTTNERIGDIVDLFWGEDDAEVFYEIFQFALAYFYSKGIKRTMTWLKTNTILDEIGQHVGFISTAQKRYLCCKTLDPTYSWLEDPGHWFLTMADAEIF